MRPTTVLLVSLAALVLLATHASTTSTKSTPSIAVHAARRGNPRMHLQDGSSVQAHYINATTHAESGSLSGARPLSLASDDLNVDGFPDLVSGYTSANGSFVTLSLGNPEAFAPTKPETIEAIKNGQFHDSFLPDVTVLAVPDAPEFLGVGDFDRDGHRDILTATRGNDTMYLMPGNDTGGFSAPQSLHLPGAVTAMITGRTDNALSEVAVGISSDVGSQVLVYAAKQSVLTAAPVTYSLPASAIAITIGQLDDSSPMDLAVAAGNQVLIIHDAGQPAPDQSSVAAFHQSQIEHIDFSSAVTSVALGDFISDRQSRTELAALGNDGTIHVLTRGQLDTRPISESEVFEQRQKLALLRERKDFDAVVPRSWRPDKSQSWSEAQSLTASAPVSDGGVSQRLLISAKIATGPGEQLMMMDTASNQLQVVMNDQPSRSVVASTQADSARNPVPVPLDAEGAPVAAVSMSSTDADVAQDPGSVSPDGSGAPVTALSIPSTEADTAPNLVSVPLEVEGAPIAALSMRLSVMALPGLVVVRSRASEASPTSSGVQIALVLYQPS